MNMNFKLIKYCGLIVVTCLFLVSCYKEPAIPAAPHTNLKANITIKALKDSLQGTSLEITQDWIICGIVNSNDKSGNFHKQINIQDSTAGINIQIEANGLYAKYAVGQEVIIKCKGLWLYNYRGTIQLCGSVVGETSTRIPELYLPSRFFLNGYPNPANIPVQTIILGSAKNDNYLSMLVKIENVEFTKAVKGLTWATENAAQSRSFIDEVDEMAIVRTSNYANFALDIIPSDQGTLMGIWSAFGSDRQLFFRDLNDLIDFTVYEKPILIESFSSNFGGFTTWNELGEDVWFIKPPYGVVIEGIKKRANKDWLISPSLDLSAYKTVTLTFEHAINYAGVNKLSYHTLWMTTDNGLDYNTYNWVQVPITTYPTVNGWTFVSSGDISFPAEFVGQKNNVKFAFKYESKSPEFSTWEIKNVKVDGKE